MNFVTTIRIGALLCAMLQSLKRAAIGAVARRVPLALVVLTLPVPVQAFELISRPPVNDRGPYQQPEKFDPQATYFGMRWFPTHVDFGPDNDTLLVSLCHVWRPEYCRIGKLRISDRHWDILPFEEKRTYREPIFSPDGKWIVYSGAPCNKNARCEGRGFQLFRTTPDGGRTELLANSSAFHPAFSADGRKLIYWKWVAPPDPKGTGAVDLYQLEVATGKETALTQIAFMGEDLGKVFFTPDGKRFVFDAAVMQKWSVDFVSCTKPPVFPPKDPKARMEWYRHGPGLFGYGYDGVRMFSASMEQIPLNKDNCADWQVLWSGEGSVHPLAMDRQGRVLYHADLVAKKRQGNPVALAIGKPEPGYTFHLLTYDEEDKRYPFRQLTDEQIRRGEGTVMMIRKAVESNAYRGGNGVAFFLRKPMSDARDEAAFDAGGACSDSISPDGKRLAYVTGICGYPTNDKGLCVIGVGERMAQTTILNWPRLELKSTPASHP